MIVNVAPREGDHREQVEYHVAGPIDRRARIGLMEAGRLDRRGDRRAQPIRRVFRAQRRESSSRVQSRLIPLERPAR